MHIVQTPAVREFLSHGERCDVQVVFPTIIETAECVGWRSTDLLVFRWIGDCNLNAFVVRLATDRSVLIDKKKSCCWSTGDVGLLQQHGDHLMALAIRFDGLIQSGAVENYSELARLVNVTRARMTQIMNLLMLAPQIQEQILFSPRVEQG